MVQDEDAKKTYHTSKVYYCVLTCFSLSVFVLMAVKKVIFKNLFFVFPNFLFSKEMQN